MRIEADESLNGSCKSHMSITFRICSFEGTKERFIGFFCVSVNKNAKGLAEVNINALNDWGVTNNIVSQTYDGTSVIACDRLKFFAKQVCTEAIFFTLLCSQTKSSPPILFKIYQTSKIFHV